MYVYNIWSLLYVCVRETLFLAGPEEKNEWMSKFLLRRKYFQRHSQLLNSIATEIVFVLKIWNWYFGKQENASKTFWLTFHLFLVLLQNQLCQNIPVTLLQLFQLPNPSAPEAPLFAEFWIQSLQIASCNFILLNISKGSQQIFLVIANISSTIIPERRYIYFFSILLDCTRCPDSTGALSCRMLVFQISFFPVCRIYFLVLVGNFVYLFCDVVSQDCLIFCTAGALVVLRI